VTGVAGNGEQIVCEFNDGWRWESPGDAGYQPVAASPPPVNAPPSTSPPATLPPATDYVPPPANPPVTAAPVDYYGRQYLNIVDHINNNQTNLLGQIQSGQASSSTLKAYIDSYQTAINGLEAVTWPVSVIPDMQAEIGAFQTWAGDLGVLYSDNQLGSPPPDQSTVQQYNADFNVVHADALKVRADLGLSPTAS
jgi:hypothetical protein